MAVNTMLSRNSVYDRPTRPMRTLGGDAGFNISQPPGKEGVVPGVNVPAGYAPATNDAVMTGQQDVSGQYDFRETPGYDWRRDQGAQVRQNSLTGRGLALSGRAAKEMERFGQDYGAAEYQNVFNRRAAIAGVAQPITQQINQAGMNMGNNVSNALMQGGNAQASAYMNQGQAWNNAIQGGIQNYMFNNALNGG